MSNYGLSGGRRRRGGGTWGPTQRYIHECRFEQDTKREIHSLRKVSLLQ